MTAEEVIRRLNLAPHPEGGWYRQTWQASDGPRASGTCIFYLLEAGGRSHWHRVDATEIWHFYAGNALTLRIAARADGLAERFRLGPDLAAGEVPQVIVPQDAWQSAEAGEGWALVGCTVSPGFEFGGFELAPADFDIPER